MENKLGLFLLLVLWKTATALCSFPFVITRRLLLLPALRAMPGAVSERDGVQLPFLLGTHVLAQLPLLRSVLILQILFTPAKLLAETKSLE